MDNEEYEKTKDYSSELELQNEEVQDEDYFEDEFDTKKKKKKKFKKVYNENYEDEFEEEKPKKKRTILVVITSILLLACLVCIIVLIVNHAKGNNEPNTPVISKIQRPSDDEKYIALKQSNINITCRHTQDGKNYKQLTKGLVIDCIFGYDINPNIKISELYFDLNNSANVKLKDTKNDSKYELLNEKNTYKLIPNDKENVFTNGLHFYFEVLNSTDEVGYVEIANIVLKDDDNKYYKAINSIESFPPEYDDKLYIYKEIYDEGDSVYYYSSKTKYSDKEVFDTFQCKNETCDTKTEANNYFLIYDENLLVYDTLKKTSNTLNISEDIKIEDYTYEFMLNSKGNIYGITFKKNYTSALDCDMNEYVCINTGLSGYEIGYYSMALNNFSIALDYGFIGSSAFNGYDVAMMLKKDNQYGIFSFENDNMMVELSDKYKAIEYDDETESIMLEVYDEQNKNYYFEYYDPVYSQYTLNTENLQKFDNSTLYYTTAYNNKGIMVTMLFDNKGNPIKKLPYVLSEKLVSVSDKIVIKNDMYEVYDLKGNKLYVSKYDPKDVYAYTNSYIVINKNDKIALLDSNGEDLVDIKELKSGVKFISAEEKETGILTVIIKDAAITEEGKNAYKYIIEYNKPFQTETIFVE